MFGRLEPLESSEEGRSGGEIIFKSPSVGQVTLNSISDEFQVEK